MGLSAESTVRVVLPLLFAFGGGSAIAFLHKLTPDDRKRAAGAIAALSLSCLIGVYSGVAVSEYQLLTPARQLPKRSTPIADNRYLRSLKVDEVQLIDQRYKTKEYTAERAYAELYKLITAQSP